MHALSRLLTCGPALAAALTSLAVGACSGEGAADPASAAESASAAATETAAPATPTTAAAPLPAGPPSGAPNLPGLEFPSFGALREGAKAYFPTREVAARLSAGEVDAGGMTWFRGEVVSVDGDAASAAVRDVQGNEYAVPLSYVIQAAEPVREVAAGQVYLGERFNRPELVLILDTTSNDRGEIPTLGLAAQMPDSVRSGSDPLDELVPVVDGGIGSQAICRGPNGVRGYRVLRRVSGKVLGYDGLFVRMLPEASCRFAPLRPDLSPGQRVVYASGTGHREGTVSAIDPATGAVQVTYTWGASEREDTTRFGSIVTELPPAD